MTKHQHAREAARLAAETKVLNYDNITIEDLGRLILMLNVELKKYTEFKMKVSRVLKGEFKFDRKGLISAYIKVDGSYFKKREAISFNPNGFIGFAGWASVENVKPICDTFIEWLKTIN